MFLLRKVKMNFQEKNWFVLCQVLIDSVRIKCAIASELAGFCISFWNKTSCQNNSLRKTDAAVSHNVLTFCECEVNYNASCASSKQYIWCFPQDTTMTSRENGPIKMTQFPVKTLIWIHTLWRYIKKTLLWTRSTCIFVNILWSACIY